MGLLNGFHRTTQTELADQPIRKKLVEFVLDMLRDQNGRIRVEDAISAAATVVGERCIDAAGDYPLSDHELPPGSRAFSTKANELICGDVTAGGVNRIPADSVVGVLRAGWTVACIRTLSFPTCHRYSVSLRHE